MSFVTLEAFDAERAKYDKNQRIFHAICRILDPLVLQNAMLEEIPFPFAMINQKLVELKIRGSNDPSIGFDSALVIAVSREYSKLGTMRLDRDGLYLRPSPYPTNAPLVREAKEAENILEVVAKVQTCAYLSTNSRMPQAPCGAPVAHVARAHTRSPFCEAHRCKSCPMGTIRMMARGSDLCRTCAGRRVTKRSREWVVEEEDEEEERPARRARKESSNQ
jgi:hypothetical protein